MILVDTSIWVDHFRKRIPDLDRLIDAGRVLGHPYVTGELAVGDLTDWTRTVAALRLLPTARIASEDEFLTLLAGEGLIASGLGYVDVHLLASCKVAPETLLWSSDKRLARQAERLGVAWKP